MDLGNFCPSRHPRYWCAGGGCCMFSVGGYRMRSLAAFLSALFVLLLVILPVSAQTLKISSSPRELGTAILRILDR